MSSSFSSSQNNTLVILLDLFSSTPRELSLPPFYKDFIFDRAFLIGKYATSISKVKNLKLSSSDSELIPLEIEATKLFIHLKNIDKTLINDPYQAPYENTILSRFIDLSITTPFYYCEEGSWFDTIPFKYQLASILKPHHFPFYVKESKISSFKDFEKELFHEGIDVIKSYLSAGFHLLENNLNIPGWSISPNLSWISLILSLYNVIPITSDLLMYQEIMSLARMRATIFYLSVYTIKKIYSSNSFPTNSFFLTEKEDKFFSDYLDSKIREKVFKGDREEFGRWTSLETYENIRI